MREPSEIIVRPLLTEKSTDLQKLNKFSFEVASDATKIDIRHAIESLGNCQVEKINTLSVKGKMRPTRKRRGFVRTAGWKKAVVTLRAGETLGGVLGQAFETA